MPVLPVWAIVLVAIALLSIVAFLAGDDLYELLIGAASFIIALAIVCLAFLVAWSVVAHLNLNL
jgi:hypothetical protein